MNENEKSSLRAQLWERLSVTGYTNRQLDEIQKEWDVRFPPDLLKHYQQHRTVTALGIDWLKTSKREIRYNFSWPFEGLLEAVRRGMWWPEWGARPWREVDAEQTFTDIFAKAPRLIPLHQHICIPESPHESGNPIFSVFMRDTIYAAANLAELIDRDAGVACGPVIPTKHIRFWARLVELNTSRG
jgi:hypothetical protein